MANQSQISCEASTESGNEIKISGPGQMTKVAAMHIHVWLIPTIRCHCLPFTSFKMFFIRKKIYMILKLSMQLRGLELDKVYVNDDPWLTLVYFTASSDLVAYSIEWGNVFFKVNLMGNKCDKCPNFNDRRVCSF